MSNTNIQFQVLEKKGREEKLGGGVGGGDNSNKTLIRYIVKASTINNQYIQVKRLLVKMKEIEKRLREDANEKLYLIATTLKLYEVSMWEEIEDAG